MNNIRPRHFGIAPAPISARAKPDHRGTLLTPLLIIYAWATVVGFYHIAAFVIDGCAHLVTP